MDITMTEKQTILIVEDEASTSRLLYNILKEQGYNILNVSTGKEACSLVSSHLPDLMLLNLGLPDMDGFEVIRYIRRWSNMPIIVVSSRSRESDKVAALDTGADDYITKPFGKAELSARIRAALRYRRMSVEEEQQVSKSYYFDGLEVNFDKHTVSVGKMPVRLTRIEFKILALLCNHSGKVITYDYMLKKIWGPYAKNDNKILRVNITNIRKKLETDTKSPKYIFTEPGIGYRIPENEL